MDAEKLEGEMRQAMAAITEVVQKMDPEVSARAAAGGMIRLAAFMMAAQNVPPDEFLRWCRTQNADAEAYEAKNRRPGCASLH